MLPEAVALDGPRLVELQELSGAMAHAVQVHARARAHVRGRRMGAWERAAVALPATLSVKLVEEPHVAAAWPDLAEVAEQVPVEQGLEQ